MKTLETITLPSRKNSCLGRAIVTAVAGVSLALAGPKVRCSPHNINDGAQTGAGTSVPAAPPVADSGVEPVQVEMTDDEMALLKRQNSDAGFGTDQTHAPRLPPDHEYIQTDMNVGIVQGADFGFELGANGSSAGTAINFNTLITQGALGTRLLNGTLTLRNKDNGWGVDAGLISSDIWGPVYGVRYLWRGQAGHSPALGIYNVSQPGAPGGIVLAYSDAVKIRPNVGVGGEIQSDGSLVATSGVQFHRFNVDVDYRRVSVARLDGFGGSATYDFANRVSVYGSITREGLLDDLSVWNVYGIRLPLAKRIDLALESTRTETAISSATGYSAMVMLPLKPVILQLRYQVGGYTFTPTLQPLDSISRTRQNFSLAAAWKPTKRLGFDYQTSVQWGQDNRATDWGQLTTTLRISDKTNFQLINGVPAYFNENQMRLQLNHRFGRDLSIGIEYGVLTPYQSLRTTRLQQGFMLMIRSSQSFATPSHGAIVSGIVTDQAGNLIKNAIVQLGDYRAPTDAQGRYEISNIPEGRYTLLLADDSLTADYQSDKAARELTLKGRSRVKANFTIVPLHSIIGRVWEDKNGDGKYDSGEGIRDAVVRMGNAATLTDRNGDFMFYNVVPGAHTISIDAARLRGGLAPASPAQIAVELPADRSVSGLEFRVKFHDKPAVLDELK